MTRQGGDQGNQGGAKRKPARATGDRVAGEAGSGSAAEPPPAAAERRGDGKRARSRRAPRKAPVTGGDRPASSASHAEPDADSQDVLFVHSKRDSGEGYNVIRHREDRLEVGELRELREGKPIVGELVKLTPRKGQERLFNVETLMESSDQPVQRAGPAKVATEAYRQNWDAIFGAPDAEPPDSDDMPN